MFQTAFEWLSKNKEWLFSGIGIVAIGTLVRIFWPSIAAIFVDEGTDDSESEESSNSVEAAKERIRILFIDDDVKFRVVSILQTAGWQHTRIVKDVTSLNEEGVKKAHILFVDINGVGKKLGFKDEGLGLALALKTEYPEKKLVIYSADNKAERFHEAWKKADEYLGKNADPYQFQQIVEELALAVDA